MRTPIPPCGSPIALDVFLTFPCTSSEILMVREGVVDSGKVARRSAEFTEIALFMYIGTDSFADLQRFIGIIDGAGFG